MVTPSLWRIDSGTPDPDTVARLLASLPEWFGLPDANRAYVADAATMPTYLARRLDTAEDSDPVGVLLLCRHFAESAEIHLMAVDPRWHRHGIGRALIAAAEADLRASGTRLLSVKTLGPSHPEPHYISTRAFYRSTGFWPVEELLGLWPDNPCLLLVKPLTD